MTVFILTVYYWRIFTIPCNTTVEPQTQSDAFRAQKTHLMAANIVRFLLNGMCKLKYILYALNATKKEMVTVMMDMLN